MPDERTVVLSWVVVVGAGTRVVDCVVVVVVGTGFSTTVVHEVKSTAATARSGVTIISFFIVGVVSFMDRSSQVVLPDVFLAKISKLISCPGSRQADTEGALVSHPRCCAISSTSIFGALIRECVFSTRAGEENVAAGLFRGG